MDEKIFKNYQAKYPNLAPFTFDTETNSLIYEGNYIKLNGSELSKINEVFFNLSSDGIYQFIKNGFYRESHINEQIINLTNQFVITEEEYGFIRKYVSKYLIKLELYKNNKAFFDKYIFLDESVKNFVLTFMKSGEIIKTSQTNSNDVYQMINHAYKDLTSTENNKMTETKGLTLTRSKKGIDSFKEFDKNEEYLNELNEKQKFGMAGFSSLILILCTVVAAGSYLALFLLG